MLGGMGTGEHVVALRLHDGKQTHVGLRFKLNFLSMSSSPSSPSGDFT